MKISFCLTALLTLSMVILASDKLVGQNVANRPRLVHLRIDKQSLSEVLKTVQQQTGYKIFYQPNSVNQRVIEKVDLQGKTAVEALESILSGTGLTFNIDGQNIIITPEEQQNATKSDNKNIAGIVVDDQGQPLPGVTVKLKQEKRRSTATDQNGHFSIEVNSNEETLIFSFIGFLDQEILVGEKTAVRVVMKMASSSLDEVQVIGYGTTTRRLNTGSVSSITQDDLSKQTVTNPMQALAGRIPGLNMVQSNGNPGSNQTINIRGVNNLGNAYGLSGALPLVVIDGVPYTNFNASFPFNDNLNNSGLSGANGGLSIFATVNPQDIERIDVLKDADATAIYGSRGANGVILITTKKGKGGKAQLSANLYTGTQKVGRFVDMLNTEQYLELRREAFRNDGVTPTASNAPDLITWDQNAYTNWQKFLIGKTARLSDVQLNYSGGNERIQFFSSGNYHHEGSVYPGDYGNTRLIGRLTLTTNSANRKLKTNFSISYADDQTDLPTSDVANTLSLPPNYPLYNPDGTLYWGANFTNPWASFLTKYGSGSQNFTANGNIDYSFLKYFHAKINAGYTRNSLSQRTENPIAAQNPNGFNAVSNSASFATSVATNYIVEPQLDFRLHLGKNNISALVGGTFQENLNDASRTNGSNYAFEALLSSINGAGTVTGTSSYSLYRYAAMFGKINYDYNERYLLNLTFRRDASSRFGPNNQFANFGAVGAAWIFSDEDFIKDNVKFLSFAKLRGSYGTTGNDQLSNYAYLSLYNSGPVYQNTATLTVGGIANPNLRWESTNKLEFGLDLGFLDNRIMLTANAYQNRSDNLLTFASPSNQTGFNSINVNLAAQVQNKGWEFQLNSTNIDSKNFKWSSNFNVSFQKNKLRDFPDQDQAFYGSTFVIGQPVPPRFVYSFAGVDPATGRVIINDLDGNTATLNTNDRYVANIGTPYFGGLNNTLKYRDFSLDFFLQFNHSRGTINQVNGTRPGSLNNQNVSVLDRWRNPGDTGTLFPGASANAGAGVIYSSYTQFGSSDFYYGNNSWLKLRSASVSYTIPKSLIERFHIGNARVFLQGQNLLTFAKNKYLLDPESGNALPPLRTIVAGLNLTFN